MRYLFLFGLLIITPLTYWRAVDETDVISTDNVEKLEVLHSWQSNDEGFVAGAFSHSGDFLAIALNDGVVQLLDTTSWEVTSILEGGNLEGTEIRFSRDDSRLMLTHWDGMIRVWDLEIGDLIFSVEPSDTRVWYEVDADLQNYWTYDDVFHVQHIENDIIRFQSIPTPNPVILDLYSDGDLMAIATEDNHLLLYNLVVEEVVYEFNLDIDADLNGIGFSPDGDLIWASWQDWFYLRSENPSVIRFWSVDTGMEQFELIGDGSSYSRIIFEPAGDMVAVVGEDSFLQNVIQIWHLQNGEYIGDAGIPTGGGIGNFSQNGELFALQGGSTSSVHIWNVKAPVNSVYVRLEVGSGPNSAPVFSPDGHYLLTVNGSIIRLWGVPESDE